MRDDYKWWQATVARKQFRKVATFEQHNAISELTRANGMHWAIWWDEESQCIGLRAIRGPDRLMVSVPFDENSTTDDVQTFVDMLKVADVHDG